MLNLSTKGRRTPVILSALFGVLFASMNRLGQWLDNALVGGFPGAALWVALFLASGLVFYGLARGLPGRQKRVGRRLSGRAAFWIAFGVLLLAWLPYWLAFWPGLLNYDADFQLMEVLRNDYSTIHPLLHTLLMGAWYRLGEALGSPTMGLILYEAFQLSLVAGCIAYFFRWAYRRFSLGKVGCALFLLFFGALPVIPIMALSLAKDTFLACFGLLQATLFLECYEEDHLSKGKFWALVASGVGMLLFRTNAFYAFLAVPLMALVLRKQYKGKGIKTPLCYGLCVTVLFLLVSQGLTALTQAKQGPMRESLSIPANQVGRVWYVHRLDMEPALLADIESIFERRMLKMYNPRNADATKYALDWMKTDEDAWEFFRLWARAGKAYPKEYAMSLLYSAEGFWHLYDGADKDGLLGLDIRGEYGITQASVFPQLGNWAFRAFALNGYLRWPVIRHLFSPSLYNWLLLATVWILLWRREWMRLLCASFFAAYMVGMVFLPICLIRYALPILFIAPLCMLWLLHPQSDESQRRPLLASLHSAQPAPL